MKTRASKPPEPGRQSQCGRILRALRRAGGRWVSMPKLVVAGRSYNVHSRIDDLRHDYGIQIENSVKTVNGAPTSRKSFYRLI